MIYKTTNKIYKKNIKNKSLQVTSLRQLDPGLAWQKLITLTCWKGKEPIDFRGFESQTMVIKKRFHGFILMKCMQAMNEKCTRSKLLQIITYWFYFYLVFILTCLYRLQNANIWAAQFGSMGHLTARRSWVRFQGGAFGVLSVWRYSVLG